jgi:hypothetical protein
MTTISVRREEPQDLAPVEMIVQLFEAHGWPCEMVGEDELSGKIQGSWTDYQVQAIWRAEDHVLQLLCLPDLRVSDDNARAVDELLARINEQVWLGHFEKWSKGGVILYRHGVMLGDEGVLGLDQARALVEGAVSECDRFYPAFQFVLWGGKTPTEALDAAMVDAAGEA